MLGELHNLMFDMDDCLAKLLVNIESLEKIQFELANVRQQFDVPKTENNHVEILNYPVICILDDLLSYVLVDMNTNYEAVSLLVERVMEEIAVN